MSEAKKSPKNNEQTEYKVLTLTNGAWAIEENLVRCYLVTGENKAVLIDSCISGGKELAKVVRGITNLPTDLVFTHTDKDHTGGSAGFGTPLLHPAEYDYYHSGNNSKLKVKPIWEGDIIDLGDRQLEIILIPGHTPGSIALLDHSCRRLFVGDSISDLWIYMFGQGRNIRAFIESLKKLEARSKDFDVIHPCHGSAALGVPWIGKTIRAAEKLLAGELKGVAPLMELPCKSYLHEGVTLFY